MSNDFTNRQKICYHTTMTTQTLVRNLQKEMRTLKNKVELLESVFQISSEDMSRYKPSFLRELKQAMKEKPQYIYNGRTDPLSKLFKKIKTHA